jgi:hypothetical protein
MVGATSWFCENGQIPGKGVPAREIGFNCETGNPLSYKDMCSFGGGWGLVAPLVFKTSWPG